MRFFSDQELILYMDMRSMLLFLFVLSFFFFFFFFFLFFFYFFFLLIRATSSKKLRLRRFKWDRDEIWQNCSSSKYASTDESDSRFDLTISKWRPRRHFAQKVLPAGE